MVAMEKMRETMLHNEEKKKVLRSAILMLMVEWKNFEGDLDISAKCLGECFSELEAKEKHLTSELELITVSFEKKEEEFRAFRDKEIRELECKRKEFDGIVKLREEKLNEQEKKVENRLREIDKIRSWIGEETDYLHLKERKFMERVAEFEVKEKSLLAIEKEMENKGKVLDSAWKELTVKESCLDNVKKELRVRETELVSAKKELELKDESVDAIKKNLELKEKELTSFKERLELREDQLHSIQKEYRQRVEELDSREKGLDLVVATMQKCDGEFQLEKENFQNEQGLFKKRMEDVAHREKKVEVRCIELKQREKHIDDRFKLLQEKEKQLKAISGDPVKVHGVGSITQLENCTESFTRQETDAACPSHTKEALTSSISKVPTGDLPHSDAFANILAIMGGKNLQSFLNNHWEEHELLRVEVSRALNVADDSTMFVLEALEGFYPAEPHSKEIECNRNIIRKSCILLLEELMRISPVHTPKAKLEASKLASDWKAKMMAETQNHLAILGFLYLVGAYGLASAFDKNELESFCATVAQHGQVTQICHALGLSVINGEPLSDSVERRSKQQEGSIVHSSSDPAKIVLDALRECYSAEQQLEENSKKRKMKKSILMKIFCDLLEQLREVSPEIRPQVKIEATEFAVVWRATLTGNGLWQVQGLFNFLATFELSSLFDSDDLLGLLEWVQYGHLPNNLIKILGIADKIPCFIEKLIQRREWLQALAYIYEFELVDLFPPVSLLKNYVAHTTEYAKKLRGNGPKSPIKAIRCELSALRAAIQCIVLHNLQSEYSPDPLKARISELDREMTELCAANEPIPQVQKTVKKQKVEHLLQQPQMVTRSMSRRDLPQVMLRKFPGPNNHSMVASSVPSIKFDKIRSWIGEETDDLHLKERKFVERVAEFEVTEKSLLSMEKEMGTKGKVLEKENFRKEQGLFKKRMEDVAHREKQVEVRYKELKQREKRVDNRFKLLYEKERQLKAISSNPVKAEPIDYVKVDRVGSITQLEKCAESLTRQEADATCPSHTKEALTSSIPKAPASDSPHSDALANILAAMGGKNLQSFLNSHWEEHELLRVEVSRALKVADDSTMFVLEALEGFYPAAPHSEEVECNRTIIRKSCILLLEELMRLSPDATPMAELEASKLASEWKTKMMAETDNHLAILGFLFLVGAYGLASAFDKNELEKLCSTVSQHGQVAEICHALNISVVNIVHSSLDPAKIVLDALRKCYYAQLKTAKKRKRKNLVVVKSFPALLEQLREVSPGIRPLVKTEATEFAVAWRAKVTGSWQVLGLFNFLATFELSSLFDSDDLLGLLEMVQVSDLPINLIKILGIADKIPCFIENLIQRREWLQAFAYIYEFELVDLFPPVPLMKNYVTYATEQAKKIRGNGPCCLEDREKAISCELSALRAAVECIVLHNLQSEYSTDPLGARISELEREKANFGVANQLITQVQKAVEKQKHKQQKVEQLHQ